MGGPSAMLQQPSSAMLQQPSSAMLQRPASQPDIHVALAGPTNALTPENQQIIAKFLQGDKSVAQAAGGAMTREIVLNVTQKYNEDKSHAYVEQIIFEMNAESGKWRKLRRKVFR